MTLENTKTYLKELEIKVSENPEKYSLHPDALENLLLHLATGSSPELAFNSYGIRPNGKLAKRIKKEPRIRLYITFRMAYKIYQMNKSIYSSFSDFCVTNKRDNLHGLRYYRVDGYDYPVVDFDQHPESI